MRSHALLLHSLILSVLLQVQAAQLRLHSSQSQLSLWIPAAFVTTNLLDMLQQLSPVFVLRTSEYLIKKLKKNYKLNEINFPDLIQYVGVPNHDE